MAPGLGWILVGTCAWVAGGLMVLLALPGLDAADAPLVLGLPRRAAFLLLGVGLAPGLILPLAYARVFDDQTLSDDDLARLKDAAERVRSAEREAGDPPERDPVPGTGPGHGSGSPREPRP